MARTPDGIHARTEVITVRGTKAWVQLVDRLRGDQSRSAYLRSLIERDRADRERQAHRP